MRFWRKDNDAEIEELLRESRPQAPPEFVRAVVDDITKPRRASPARVRLAFAAGLTLVILAALAGTGGLGYAASGITQAIDGAMNLGGSGPQVSAKSPSQDQYKPGKGCGDRNHLHERQYQCKVKVNDVTKKEGNSGTTPFVFTVSLDDAPVDTVTVGYTTANGTATAGQDYLATAGTLTFATGVTTQTITVYVIGDTVREANETFYVNLTSVSANAVIIGSQGVGTITNDDR